MHVVTVVQARSSSTRLPGKVLRPVLGRPVLLRQVDRMRRAELVGEIVIATSIDPADEIVADVATDDGLAVVRGSPNDLLDRHATAARAHDADIVVKIPSDCPLIDPTAIDLVVGAFLDGSYDFVSNLHPPSWPDGNDVEVMARETLETAWAEATEDFEREHTTPFIWERPDRFRINNVAWPTGRDLSMSHRWTLDYPEDLAFITAIYEAFSVGEEPAPAFGTEEIVELIAKRPELAAINADFVGVNWYRHHLDQLSTVHSTATRPAPTESP